MGGRSPEQGRGHEEWFLLSGKELCACPAPLKTPSAFRDPSGSPGLFQTIPQVKTILTLKGCWFPQACNGFPRRSH